VEITARFELQLVEHALQEEIVLPCLRCYCSQWDSLLLLLLLLLSTVDASHA
jgi:hypothetical protein